MGMYFCEHLLGSLWTTTAGIPLYYPGVVRLFLGVEDRRGPETLTGASLLFLKRPSQPAAQGSPQPGGGLWTRGFLLAPSFLRSAILCHAAGGKGA